ncbi:MAG: DUF1573 domain-containing protein [Bacteroidales bacterium]|nr:DUF1573 domain-containing protein [Bacteroidales bacterium]
MKTLRLSLMMLCLLGSAAVALAEGPDISFAENVHDFGTVKEDGKVTCTFEFTNTGDMPLEIRRATASCGCTTPSFTREPVAPGQTGRIEVAYNTEGRPGNFNKTITVYSNSILHPTYSLTIRGSVIPRENSPESTYPKAFGLLRLKTTTLALDDVRIGGIASRSIPIYNNAERPMTISFSQVPAHMRVSVSNSEIPAGGMAIVTVNYISAEARDFGHREDYFYIHGKTATESSGKITVTANLVEDFSSLRAGGKLPVANYSRSTVNFGEVKADGPHTTEILLTNDGEAPLKIRKLSSQVSQLTLKSDKKEIQPGKSATIKIELNTKDLQSGIRYYVEVITNDPAQPVKRITVNANIVH